ncbi:MAG: hypothetical protein JSW46_12185 [Gemmatimonadota bacterium]|nr:MAG: hypothetical protein JSW46_12185 [Gemmatimonadota bacterium]
MIAVRLIDRARRGDGFAIPAAIFVIVVLTLVALAGLYVAQSNATANTGIRLSLRALYAADAGATEVIGTWDRGAFLQLNPGDSAVTEWRTLPGGSKYRTSVLRVDDDVSGSETLFRLRTVGRPARGTAQRVLVNMVRVRRADVLCCDAAIKLQGSLWLQGVGAGVKVSGIDTPPVAWGATCPADRTDIPGVLMQETDSLRISGAPIIEGTPPIDEDPTIASDDFLQFGDISYTDLTRMADKQLIGDQVIANALPSVDEDGRCAEWELMNWGDPLNPGGPCWDYMPVIHASGDMTVSGNGLGQGILLVDGDLIVTGTFEFYGLVIVQGEADFRGTTELNGTLLSRNGATAGEESWLAGGTTLQYSSCSALRALQHAIVAEPLAGRNWFEAFE